jgi:hypothetical protein
VALPRGGTGKIFRRHDRLSARARATLQPLKNFALRKIFRRFSPREKSARNCKFFVHPRRIVTILRHGQEKTCQESC